MHCKLITQQMCTRQQDMHLGCSFRCDVVLDQLSHCIFEAAETPGGVEARVHLRRALQESVMSNRGLAHHPCLCLHRKSYSTNINRLTWRTGEGSGREGKKIAKGGFEPGEQ